MADNGFIRLIYGLAKKYGIDTTGLEPHEVVELLKQRGLLKPYNSQGNKAVALAKKINEKHFEEKATNTSFKEDLTENAKTALKKVETKTKGLSYEVGTIIDKDGNVLQSIDGKSNEVSVDKALLKNAIFTHNHPNGSCFSYDDMQSFLDGEVFQLRATTDKGKTYILTRMKDFVNPSLAYNYKKASAFRGEGQERIQELFEGYINSGYSHEKAYFLATSDYREEWLTKNGKQYNVKFEVKWDE